MFVSYGLLGKCLMFKETMCLGREILSVSSINKDVAGRIKVVGKIDGLEIGAQWTYGSLWGPRTPCTFLVHGPRTNPKKVHGKKDRYRTYWLSMWHIVLVKPPCAIPTICALYTLFRKAEYSTMTGKNRWPAMFSEHLNILPNCHIGESQFLFPEPSTHFPAAAAEDWEAEYEEENRAELDEGSKKIK